MIILVSAFLNCVAVKFLQITQEYLEYLQHSVATSEIKRRKKEDK